MEEKFLIWSEEHGAWWRTNASGYTRSIREAGRYTAEQAASIVFEANRGGTFNEMAIVAPIIPAE